VLLLLLGLLLITLGTLSRTRRRVTDQSARARVRATRTRRVLRSLATTASVTLLPLLLGVFDVYHALLTFGRRL
jgi:hypothetical protein